MIATSAKDHFIEANFIRSKGVVKVHQNCAHGDNHQINNNNLTEKAVYTDIP